MIQGEFGHGVEERSSEQYVGMSLLKAELTASLTVTLTVMISTRILEIV